MFDFSARLKQHFAALQSEAQFFPYVTCTAPANACACARMAEPPSLISDEGAMLTVRLNGVEAYAATNDIS